MEAIGTEFSDTSIWESPTISLGEKPDPLQMESDVQKPLNERAVADLTATKKTRYNLDRCIDIESYTDLFRQKMVQAWERRETLYSIARTVVVLVAGTITLVAPSIPLKIAAALIGVIGFIYLKFYLSSKTSQQIQLWNTPSYEKPAQQRALAYLEPFLAVYRLHGTPSSLTSVLHPNEIEHLYKKYLTHFCDKLLLEKPSPDLEKKAWMAEFLTLNPLTPLMMQRGWEKIPSSFEEIQQEYSQLFAEPISYSMLQSKFAAFHIEVVGSIRRSGAFLSPSYLYELEGLVIKYEHALEELRNGYLTERETLKASYGKHLKELSTESSLSKLQSLNDQFEYDLKHIKNSYLAQSKDLKATYQERLQELKNQFTGAEPNDLEERLEKRWNELHVIFIEDKSLNLYEGHYEEARNLLERVKKELNPSLLNANEPPKKIEPPKKKPDKTCLDVRDALNCPFS